MTVDAKRVLRGLKSAQIRQDELLLLDFDRYTASTLVESGHPCGTYDFSKYKTSIIAILEYLEDNGMLSSRDETGQLYQVTHAGWNARRISWENFVLGAFKSVALPCIVAFLTALIALWVNGLYSSGK
jgi:hypothetical protein